MLFGGFLGMFFLFFGIGAALGAAYAFFRYVLPMIVLFVLTLFQGICKLAIAFVEGLREGWTNGPAAQAARAEAERKKGELRP